MADSAGLYYFSSDCHYSDWQWCDRCIPIPFHYPLHWYTAGYFFIISKIWWSCSSAVWGHEVCMLIPWMLCWQWTCLTFPSKYHLFQMVNIFMSCVGMIKSILTYWQTENIMIMAAWKQKWRWDISWCCWSFIAWSWQAIKFAMLGFA